MNRWINWRNAILGTLAGLGVWLAAIMEPQPSVEPPRLPVVACGVNRWVVTNDYTTTINGVRITIERDFVTDYASIPPAVTNALGITRDHPTIRRGALAHDWVYRYHTMTKDQADMLLYHACIEDGMTLKKARAVMEGVRLYGFLAWDR